MAPNAASLWHLYGDTFRLHAHQLLLWAHQDARGAFRDEMDEPAMTGLLADAMKRRLNDPRTPEEYDRYWPGDQEPHSPAGQLGKDRLRLDITITRNGAKPRIAYVFEAKRLKSGSFPIGEYAGAGGMGDFISSRYASDAPEAAMVGLYENKTLEYWHSELHRIFKEDSLSKAPRLAAKSSPRPVAIHAELSGELESTHERKEGGALRLFHLFLDCRAESGAQPRNN